MSHSLSRAQAVLLGFVVVAALALGGYGVARIADKQGFWAETTEVAVGFAEAEARAAVDAWRQARSAA